MTLEEYGAWFIGFSAEMPCPPGIGHWALIKQRVDEIDGISLSAEAYLALSRQTVAIFGDLHGFNSRHALEALGRQESAKLSQKVPIR